jgi:predicted RNA-binding Zn-ribbon protein involved in translation (DUF1610 family)
MKGTCAMQFKTYFLLLKFITVIIALIGGAIVQAGYTVVGVTIVVVIMMVDYMIRRCPYCGENLSIGLHVKSTTHCPNCGEILNGESNKEK